MPWYIPAMRTGFRESRHSQDTSNHANASGVLRNTPRRTILIFLLAVFFVFSALGVAGDIMDTGRQPTFRFALGILISGLFAAFYAYSGIRLRGRFWIVFVPVFTVHVLLMGMLARHYPDLRQPVPMDAAAIARMQSRLTFDGIAITVAVWLGYAGFVVSSISEARRYAGTRTEMAILENEMTAAREVQQVMLPATGESFPGFALESVYKPARQVGGDFFQILRAGDRGLLIVFGDVAGKGVPAAMLVSLLVGSIRAIADDTNEPAIVLRKLHDRLVGRISGGFATALAAHITAEGAVSMANAGHLSPYLDGSEVELPGALPLGVPAGGQYETRSLTLHPGSRLTFFSDGVVEAQTKAGELFGFDRARAISTQSASSIAEAAVQFGQSDDITVVTIQRLASGSWPECEDAPVLARA